MVMYSISYNKLNCNMKQQLFQWHYFLWFVLVSVPNVCSALSLRRLPLENRIKICVLPLIAPANHHNIPDVRPDLIKFLGKAQFLQFTNCPPMGQIINQLYLNENLKKYLLKKIPPSFFIPLPSIVIDIFLFIVLDSKGFHFIAMEKKTGQVIIRHHLSLKPSFSNIKSHFSYTSMMPLVQTIGDSIGRYYKIPQHSNLLPKFYPWKQDTMLSLKTGFQTSKANLRTGILHKNPSFQAVARVLFKPLPSLGMAYHLKHPFSDGGIPPGMFATSDGNKLNYSTASYRGELFYQYYWNLDFKEILELEFIQYGTEYEQGYYDLLLTPLLKGSPSFLFDFWRIGIFLAVQFGNNDRLLFIKGTQFLDTSTPKQTGYKIDIDYAIKWLSYFSTHIKFFYVDIDLRSKPKIPLEEMGLSVQLEWVNWFGNPASL